MQEIGGNDPELVVSAHVVRGHFMGHFYLGNQPGLLSKNN